MSIDFKREDGFEKILTKGLKQAERIGMSEGLRMAAEIIKNFHNGGKDFGIEIPVFGIHELIIAKAKEIDERGE